VTGFEKETDVETLREAIRLLALENERLVQLNIDLKTALAEARGEEAKALQLEIAELQQQLGARNQALFGDSSEKRPSGEPKAKPAASKPKGHGPRQQVLPDVEKVHELDVADQVCTSCGGELEEWKGQFEESREIDMYERRFVRLHHKRKKYRCRCGGCIETAPAPPKLMKGGLYSIDIAISIAVAKYLEHMPLSRLASALGRQGLRIDSQTLWDQLNALGRILSPAHEALQARVLSQPVIGADETHWKLMGKKTSGGKTKRWQVWAVTSESAVCYRIKAGRSLQDASAFLGDYRGVIVCDGYTVYNSLRKQQGGIRLANCWAHVRRKFVEVEDAETGRCTEVLSLIGQLFEVEQRARDGGLDADGMRQLRQAESKPLIDAIHAWALAQHTLPRSPLGKAIAYMGSLWDGLKVFLDEPAVAIDNNATERALRGVVVGRKNHYGSRSQRGTEVAALFYSLLETTKLAGVSPHDYLRDATYAALAGEAIPLPGDRDHGLV
jgi:transposase